MKVILKKKKINITTFVNYSKFERTFETFDIAKEDGTIFESYDPHITINEPHGFAFQSHVVDYIECEISDIINLLKWETSNITNLLKFLGIEYELQEDIKTVEEKE